MKFLKVLILLLICYTSQAQQPFSRIAQPYIWTQGGFDSLFLPNHDTIIPKDKSKAWVVVKDTTIYIWKGLRWQAFTGGVSGSGGVPPTNIYVGTIAQLRASNTVATISYISTDIPGQWKDIGLSDGQYSDNGATHIITANGRVLERVFTDDIDPKWFGAVANGTDQSVKINAAITAASLYPGGKSVIINDTFSIAGSASIILKSYVKLVFQKGGAIKLLPNNTGSYEIISVNGIHDAGIVDPVIIGDNDAHIGTTGEFGMGIYMVNSKNITVRNATISKCWGDGIYIGSLGTDSTQWNKNLQFLGKTIITDCRRQGVSVICGYDLYFEYLYAKDIIGTAPSAAIDFEPNNGTQDITFRAGTIEGINTDAALLFVHLGGEYDINISKVIDTRSRHNSGDGGFLFLGGATAIKNTGTINIGEIIQDKVASHPLFLFDGWYSNSSPKVTIGSYSLGIWDNSATSSDYKYSVINHFVATTNDAQSLIGSFNLDKLRIDSLNFQAGKVIRPYYVAGSTNVNKLTLSDVLINYTKLPVGVIPGDGQSTFKVNSSVIVRSNIVKPREIKTASFTPIDGVEYSIKNDVAVSFVYTGFNSCVLYGLAAIPVRCYLDANTSNSLITTYTYTGGAIDSTGPTPFFWLNPGEKVVLQRQNVSKLSISVLEKVNLPPLLTLTDAPGGGATPAPNTVVIYTDGGVERVKRSDNSAYALTYTNLPQTFTEPKTFSGFQPLFVDGNYITHKNSYNTGGWLGGILGDVTGDYGLFNGNNGGIPLRIRKSDNHTGFGATVSASAATQPSDVIIKAQLDSAYLANPFALRNSGGTGDTLMSNPTTSTAIMKRLTINGASVVKTDTTLTYTVNAPLNGTVSFTGNGSSTSFTIPLSVAGMSASSKIFLTAKTAIGAALNWVDVSDESITVYYLTAPTSGVKTLNYMIIP